MENIPNNDKIITEDSVAATSNSSGIGDQLASSVEEIQPQQLDTTDPEQPMAGPSFHPSDGHTAPRERGDDITGTKLSSAAEDYAMEQVYRDAAVDLVHAYREAMQELSQDEEDEEAYEDYDSDRGSNESTDYENEDIIQLQAAIDAGLVEDERQCWVCFASDEDDPTAAWVHPCRCSGTTKWVHQVCIQRWVDEKQKGNNSANVSCPQCGTDYTIRFPAAGPIMSVLDTADLLVGRLCPIVAGGVIVGGIYWSCVTFGAVTIMQVAGHEEGWQLMEAADPLLLLVSLPLVPVGLVLAKMIKWQDPIIKVLRQYLPRVPLTRFILPAFAAEPRREGSGAAASIPPSTDSLSVTRTFCGALFFPTIATFLGNTLFEETCSPLKRAVMGGLTFVAIKGVLKIYHKQHLYIRQCRREILDFPG
eukprot:TRINITY_DN24773_c0_g1_i1.p1 TRINITY_DN24773_c0_g1~~TRINITY_DN24773_c0_g1_i1.p1  ORF type:complete len:420 (-),score=95.11 TRINITY_DN24773_c0_g1_i1:242-1501(-)